MGKSVLPFGRGTLYKAVLAPLGVVFWLFTRRIAPIPGIFSWGGHRPTWLFLDKANERRRVPEAITLKVIKATHVSLGKVKVVRRAFESG